MKDFSLYGIFGFPLGHTLSPVMQEEAARALGLKAFYLPFEVSRKDFLCLMRHLPDLVLDGFNVTVPYKEEVCRFLGRLEPSARAIRSGLPDRAANRRLSKLARAMGAVNTVVRRGGHWTGFNTDVTGFLTALEKEGKFKARGKRVLILGAGGSARAVAYGLAQRGAKAITIANRTKSRAEKIVKKFQRLFPGVEFCSLSLRALGTDTAGIDLVVNATSVGLKPSDRALIRPTDFPKRTLFMDLIYKPAETRLLRRARQSGHRTLNGLGMLLYQGAEAFRLWTGRRAPVSVMRAALKQQGRN